ncbi:MAG: TetR/AcrR family transcriptional regulator [Clostridium sp.]
MNNDKYHHGDLKETLIKNGIKLLNEGGSKNFSMRKLAAMCNVSHAAPYNHFKSKEELIEAIMDYVFKELEDSLSVIEKKFKDKPSLLTLELGKQYVKFMVSNPDYLKILFLSDFKTKIKISNVNIDSKYEAFNILRNSAIREFKMYGVKEEDYSRNIVAMWSMVHGLAIMIANETIICDGDIGEFVENILVNNMKF